MDTKPTTILTGFLGAGKTTYLNHLLQNKPDTRYAIIENEYGEQSIDSELILRAEDDIVELNNGCLCCTLNDNLYDILNKLFARKEEFDEIIIEATGVADPRGLADPFITIAPIKKQFPLTRIICLVDAELIEDQLVETKEAINQITFSDVLLINKTDLVDEKYLSELTERLQKLNPLAKIFLGNQTNFPLIEIEAHNPELDDVFSKESHAHGDHGHHHHDHDHKEVKNQTFPVQKPHTHHHHDHTDEVVSFTLLFDRPFDYSTLQHRLLVYLMFQAKGLYRLKGLLWLHDRDQQCLLQSVGKRMVIDKKRPWKSNEKKESKIVFIGRNIKKEPLEKMLRQCLVKEMIK